ncbi:hypothetical protein ABZ871_06440 [Streptomyces populi]
MTGKAGKAVLVGSAAVLALSMAAGPSSAASYVDKKARHCTATCGYGIAVNYWYKKGSDNRGVEWVHASKDTQSSKTFYGRWTYKKPGGTTHVGKGWRKAVFEGKGSARYAGVDWYAGKHKGPVFPKNTKICIEFKGYATKSCGTLK